MSQIPETSTGNAEEAVRARYSAAAGQREAALCCPVDYDPQYLEPIPDTVLERDYGCGDPSRYVREGDSVLDLGSGGGKICFIAAQVVGAKGSVIGVDMNEQMLDLARNAAPEVARHIGYENVRFARGRIQDLGLDLDRLEAWLHEHPVRGLDDLTCLERETERMRRDCPLVSDRSIDVVVSNCVLNLVTDEDKAGLIREIFRVLRPGGRIALSDIVSDEPVPEHLRANPELWSGCVSGAFQERELLTRLEEAGFQAIAIEQWADEPFAVVEGIEFRSVTVTARRGEDGPRLEANQAVIYRGPWRKVEDDDGHVLVRGERAAVCAKTYDALCEGPYAASIIPVAPRVTVPEDRRQAFDCDRTAPRHPRETKGADYAETRREDGRPLEDTCC